MRKTINASKVQVEKKESNKEDLFDILVVFDAIDRAFERFVPFFLIFTVAYFTAHLIVALLYI